MNHGGEDDAGIIEQAVDRAVLARHRFNHLLHEGRVDNTADVDFGGGAYHGGCFTRTIAVDINQGEGRTEPGGLQRHTATDSLRGTGDDDHTAGEVHWVFHVESL